MNEKNYLIALGTLENVYIQHTKGSLAHEILRNDIQSYVEYLENQLQQKEDIINKIRELIDELYLTNDDKCYDIYKNILNILDNKGE